MWSCQSLIVSCRMVTVITGKYLFDIRMNVQWMESGRRGEFVDVVMCLIFFLTDMLVVHSECCVWTCRLTSIQCNWSLSHALKVVSRLCLCVLMWVHLCMLECECMLCVCYFVLCVDSHTVFPLTHDVRTHICWKTTLQSIFTILYFDTFLTPCCCTTQIPVWLRDKYCPFKIHNVWLVWVESIFQYKSSDVCVDVSHCMVMLFVSLTSAVPGIYPNKILVCILCSSNAPITL